MLVVELVYGLLVHTSIALYWWFIVLLYDMTKALGDLYSTLVLLCLVLAVLFVNCMWVYCCYRYTVLPHIV